MRNTDIEARPEVEEAAPAVQALAEDMLEDPLTVQMLRDPLEEEPAQGRQPAQRHDLTAMSVRRAMQLLSGQDQAGAQVAL